MKKTIMLLLLCGLIFYMSPLDWGTVQAFELIRNPIFTYLALFLAFLGSWRFLVPFNLLFAVFYRKDKRYALMIPLGTLSCWVTNHLIKEIIRRPRPPLTALALEQSFSFPSGHAMVSCCFVYLIYFFLQARFKKAPSFLLILYLALMLLSRVYLGVHYPSDVLIGAALGLGFAQCLHFFGGRYDRTNHTG